MTTYTSEQLRVGIEWAGFPDHANDHRRSCRFEDFAALGEIGGSVHLAGALGRPVWTLLAFTPDWRWLLDRSDSPWYPTMRLFRQQRAGDWGSVFTQVRAALRD